MLVLRILVAVFPLSLKYIRNPRNLRRLASRHMQLHSHTHTHTHARRDGAIIIPDKHGKYNNLCSP